MRVSMFAPDWELSSPQAPPTTADFRSGRSRQRGLHCLFLSNPLPKGSSTSSVTVGSARVGTTGR